MSFLSLLSIAEILPGLLGLVLGSPVQKRSELLESPVKGCEDDGKAWSSSFLMRGDSWDCSVWRREGSGNFCKELKGECKKRRESVVPKDRSVGTNKHQEALHCEGDPALPGGCGVSVLEFFQSCMALGALLWVSLLDQRHPGTPSSLSYFVIL